jgi:hypothetical protein
MLLASFPIPTREEAPMKLPSMLSITAVLSLVCIETACQVTESQSTTPPKAQKAEPPKMDPAAMMAKMMELATPGAPHAELAKRAGSWTTHFKMRMDPNGPWEEFDGTTEAKPILDGRYLEEDVTFSMMGMPMHGMQILGYDNMTGEYISLWADSMSTWWTTSSGKKDAKGAIDFKGTMVDAGGTRPFRMLVRNKGDDETEGEMYDTIPPQGEVLVMTITSKRKK